LRPKFTFAFFLLLAISSILIYAQEEQDTAGIPAEDSNTVYVIREVEFDITGRTKPFVLISNGEFKEGERIYGKENFDKYLALKTQLLLNQRVLETVSIEYSLGEKEPDSALPVKLLVHVKDTFNIVILPYPKYDSNDGFSLIIKMRDYNFLGTMSALRIDLGYNNNNGSNTFNLGIDSDIPFQAAGLDWNINFDNFFKYSIGDPLYYQNVTGISVRLPINFTTLTTGINQYLTVNEENSSDNKYLFGLPARYDGAYAATEIFGSWRVPLGISVGNFGELSYTPGLSGTIKYPYGKMDPSRKPETTLSHSIGFGRIDWIGNYRKGLTASMGNSFTWYFDIPDAPLRITLDGSAIFHWRFSKYFGFSSRLKYRQWWRWSDVNDEWLPQYSAGDVIRGVIDADIRANYMLSLNLDFPIRFLRFWPSEWFNKSKLRIFNFEMYLSPFLDFALFKGPYSKLKNSSNPNDGATSFRFKDLIATTGLEVIVFPGFFRSFYLRASIAYNMRIVAPAPKWGFFPQWSEIFIGVDHFY